MGSLNNLMKLTLDVNLLSGGLPPELGSLDNLVDLYRSGSRLSGETPLELGKLSNLYNHLRLANKESDGCIAEWLRGVWGEDIAERGLPFCGDAGDQKGDQRPQDWDREVLAAFYNVTNGANWRRNDNWLSGHRLDDWHWVNTDSIGRVSGLFPVNVGVSGEIPPALGKLTNLEHLNLDRNQLSGPIPPELGNLTNLRYLNLDGNQLSGPIPPELGNLTNLEHLSLGAVYAFAEVPRDRRGHGANELSGPIPPELGNLTNLEWLDLGSNQLSGQIPSELGNLTNLKTLYLGSNQLSGPIPPELGKLTNLTNPLGLGDNQFSGCVPPRVTVLMNIPEYRGLGLPLCGASYDQEASDSDRAALVALYNATGGANWMNNEKWLSEHSIGN